MAGKGLDIGYRGKVPDAETILPAALGIELDYPGYDGKRLPFADASQDYVYSSHCAEGHVSGTHPAPRLGPSANPFPAAWKDAAKRLRAVCPLIRAT